MGDLLQILRENSLAAVGAGLIIGLYFVGRIDESDEDHLPRFLDADDEIAWHEARLAHLQAIRQAKQSKDETLAQLVALVEDLQRQVEGMKHDHN